MAELIKYTPPEEYPRPGLRRTERIGSLAASSGFTGTPLPSDEERQLNEFLTMYEMVHCRRK